MHDFVCDPAIRPIGWNELNSSTACLDQTVVDAGVAGRYKDKKTAEGPLKSYFQSFST
jgi:hypothetical protein